MRSPNRRNRRRRRDLSVEAAVRRFPFVLQLTSAWINSVFRRHGCGHRLRNKVLLLAGHAVIKGPAVNDRQLFSKITMPGRTWNGPFQSCRMPRVVFCNSFTRKDAAEEVEDKDQLCGSKDERSIGDEHIYGLLGHEERVLSRVVNAAHLAANAEYVHRKENTVRADEGKPEMQFTKAFVHESAEHFREPEVEARKSRKERRNCHDEVEMRHYKVRVLKLNIRSRCSKENS